MRLDEHLGRIKYHSKRQIYFSKGLTIMRHKVSQALMINPKKMAGNHVSNENPNQAYWISSVDEYVDQVQTGSSVWTVISVAQRTNDIALQEI